MTKVCVIAKDGTRLMPTNIKHARRLLKKGEAEIFGYDPFTIKLTRESEKNVQKIELKMDTGYAEVGISVCSETEEYVHTEYVLLKGESERHRDRNHYRRGRRNRKRYRKPRFNNRKSSKKEGWIPPSLKHKIEAHIAIAKKYIKVIPVSKIIIEVGQFDPALIQAIEETGIEITGKQYQQGKRYLIATLREAVFQRDNHTCQICGKGINEKVVLKEHHIGYYCGDRTNRLNNLMTVCEKCHTPKNHAKGGKLWGFKPVTKPLKSATFMNVARWRIKNGITEASQGAEVEHTYGSMTKLKRRGLSLPKTHANDAYSMGDFHPKKRAKEEKFQKLRKNNRILEKLYDAKIVDIREGKEKKGSELSCNRTNRSVKRDNPNNERIYRGEKKKNGHRSIRKNHYQYRPKDIVWYEGKKEIVKGVHSYGSEIEFQNGKNVNIKKVKPHYHIGGWAKAS